ncbi:MAG: hypothetical protein RR313_01810 [Anaerovoracaceae bacterium]
MIILLGNSVTVKWTITKCDGTAEVINNTANLYIEDAFDKFLLAKDKYTIVGGVIDIKIPGDLLNIGKYNLVLVDGISKRFVSKNAIEITNNPNEVTASCNV